LLARLSGSGGVPLISCPETAVFARYRSASQGAILEVVLALTAACGALALAGGAAAFLTWRGARRGELLDPRGRVRFMGFTGVLSTVVFGFAIVLEGVLVLALEPCLAG
jgi:hypothetical protein